MNIPEIRVQQSFWNNWNAETREKGLHAISLDQAEVINSWLRKLNRTDMDLIEVGCGAGWLCSQLARFGKVVATDLSDEVLERAQKRVPNVRFVAGDFMALDVGGNYDVVVTLETIACVENQPAFIQKIVDMLKPGGYLMLATPNKAVRRPMLNDMPAPKQGELRNWTDKNELTQLLTPHFDVLQLFSITPHFNRGVLRYLNSGRLQRYAENIKLGTPLKKIKQLEERMWLGWTLMALARKRT